ncbi:hypothetical protein HX109_15445 [Galbibacter sp. BG1]|uniref:hypothetical protein n=1 Tax=Galbibacter sp. BG1 TaxID=1170699 RepID=UPI0015B8C5BE|nr:hypothetical protein [Galbibacter sp. BG1]QLE02894.1 hypothetical protein HX109_15445 [Galbibacter sp. BG1]
MTIKKLEKANSIANKLKSCKENLQKAEYIQSENVKIRKSYLRYIGCEDAIEIPENLFRTIGKLIESEYIKELNELEKQLEDL